MRLSTAEVMINQQVRKERESMQLDNVCYTLAAVFWYCSSRDFLELTASSFSSVVDIPSSLTES